MIPRVVVTTCKPFYWSLRPFAYLFNIYWSALQPVTVAGYEPLPFLLPSNFTFHSIHPETYPKERWTAGIREFLQSFQDHFFVWMLEDYWLVRPINHDAIRTLTEYMNLHRDVLRIDLTTDRLYSGAAQAQRDMAEEMYGYYDLIESDPDKQYHMSTQAAIWNRRNLLDVVIKYEEQHGEGSPWQFEMNGTGVLRKQFKNLRVLGTRQFPVRYTIGLKSGKDEENTKGIPEYHLNRMKEMGLFERENSNAG